MMLLAAQELREHLRCMLFSTEDEPAAHTVPADCSAPPHAPPPACHPHPRPAQASPSITAGAAAAQAPCAGAQPPADPLNPAPSGLPHTTEPSPVLAVLPPQREVLAALTSTAAGEAFNCEAAELLGDAVLDYLAVLHLFYTLPCVHERGCANTAAAALLLM